MARRSGEEPDEVLMSRAQAGDVRAFAELVQRYKDPMYNLAYRMLRDRQEAEDIAQETFLHVFRALNRFQTGERFSPWVYRIATNLCLDKLRRNKGMSISLDAPMGPESDVYLQVADPGDGPDAALELSELRDDVQRAVDALPERYRTIVILRHLHDRSYEEIAEIVDLPLGTVKTRLFRAREILRRWLSGVVEPQ